MGRLTPPSPLPVASRPCFLLALFKRSFGFGSCLLTSLLLILLANCTTIYKPVSLKPLSDKEVRVILSDMEEQEKKVLSFYSLGALSIRDPGWDSESNILTAGTRDPFKLKIEITHPWGRPVLHILIDETRLEVLSFADKRLYLGYFSPETLSTFLPGDFDAHLIWATLRGFPILIEHHRTLATGSDQFSLLNKEEKEIEIIRLYPESLLPKVVSFPERHLNLAFSDFQEREGIYYARKVRVNHLEKEGNLVLKNRKMLFNKTLPEKIFVLEKPPSFETFHLDQGSKEPRP